MKTDIHPEYMDAKVTCACGRATETRATVPEIHVDICSHCHPFFTGRQKLVDTAGRVERFRAKYGEGESRRKTKKAEATPPADTAEATPPEADTAEAPPEAAVETTADSDIAVASEAEVEKPTE